MASTHEQEHIMQMDDGLDPAAKATQEFLHKMSSFSLVTLFTLSLPQKSRLSITKDKTEEGKQQQQAATEGG